MNYFWNLPKFVHPYEGFYCICLMTQYYTVFPNPWVLLSSLTVPLFSKSLTTILPPPYDHPVKLLVLQYSPVGSANSCSPLEPGSLSVVFRSNIALCLAVISLGSLGFIFFNSSST